MPPTIIILSAPSGAGKTTLAHQLVAQRPDAALTVSHTTRSRRPGEVDGTDYHFISPAQFTKMIAADEFLEHATVFGNRYGTSTQSIDTLLAQGKHAILEIDWQGARAVRRKFPQSRSVFIMPPSLEVLEARLKSRKQDTAEVIAVRMQAAIDEMSHRQEYDHIITNDDFASALTKLIATLPPKKFPPDKGGRGVSVGGKKVSAETRKVTLPSLSISGDAVKKSITPAPISATPLSANLANLANPPSPPYQGGIRSYVPYNPTLTKKARENRKNPTPAENKLWREVLQNKQFKHLKFTRQKPLKDFIVDFYCAELMLAIEVDGDTHGEQQQYDQRRADELNELGVEVVRYTNQEILNNLAGVFEDLWEKVHEFPPDKGG